jgi:hypothetical protein
MSSKTISIDPQHFKLGNSKKKTITMKNGVSSTTNGTKINIHNSNIRELLLAKLQQHREKTQKKVFHTTTQPIQHKIQMNSFDETTNSTPSIPCDIPPPLPIESSNEIINHIIPDKPYGILKNGTKPTYKVWNQTHKNYENNDNNISSSPVSSVPSVSSIPVVSSVPSSIQNTQNTQNTQMIQEKEVKKNYKLGLNKKNKTISILIKNANTRKKVETDKTTYKKTPITTVKNYLKKKNFIRFGANAPTQLMRDMYENLKLCGDVLNENPKLLLDNLKEPTHL